MALFHKSLVAAVAGRQSRSRTRPEWRQEVQVDRDTVLKIGRHCRPKRTFNWPPTMTAEDNESSLKQQQVVGRSNWEVPRFQSLDNNALRDMSRSPAPSQASTLARENTNYRRDWSLDSSRTLTVTRAAAVATQSAPVTPQIRERKPDLEQPQRPGEDIQKIRGRLEDTLKFDRYYPIPDNKSMFIELSPSPSHHRNLTSRSRSVSLSRDIMHAEKNKSNAKLSEVHSQHQSNSSMANYNVNNKMELENVHNVYPKVERTLFRSCSLTELPPIKPRKLVSPSAMTTGEHQSVTNCQRANNNSNTIASHTLINASQVNRQRRSKSAESRLNATHEEDDGSATGHHAMIDNACPSQDLGRHRDDKLSALTESQKQKKTYYNYSRPEDKKLDLAKRNDSLSTPEDGQKQDVSQAVNMQLKPTTTTMRRIQKNSEPPQEAARSVNTALATSVGILSSTTTSELRGVEEGYGTAKNRSIYLDTGQESYYYCPPKSLHENDKLLHAELVNLSGGEEEEQEQDKSDSRQCSNGYYGRRMRNSSATSTSPGNMEIPNQALQITRQRQQQQGGGVCQQLDLSKPGGIDRSGSARGGGRRYYREQEISSEQAITDSFGAYQSLNRSYGTGTGATSQLLLASKMVSKSPFDYVGSPELGQSDGILDELAYSTRTKVDDQKEEEQQRDRNKCDCHNNCKCQQAAAGFRAAQQHHHQPQPRLVNNANPIGILINGPGQPVAPASSSTQLTRTSDQDYNNGHEMRSGRWSSRSSRQASIDRSEEFEFAFDAHNNTPTSTRDWHCRRDGSTGRGGLRPRSKEINQQPKVITNSSGDEQLHRQRNTTERSVSSSSSSAALSCDKNKCPKINGAQIKAAAAPLTTTSTMLPPTTMTRRKIIGAPEEVDGKDVEKVKDEFDNNNKIGDPEIPHNKISRTRSHGTRSEEQSEDGCGSYSSNFPLSRGTSSKATDYYYRSEVFPLPGEKGLTTVDGKYPIHQKSQCHLVQEKSPNRDLVDQRKHIQDGNNNTSSAQGVVGVQLAKQKPLKSTDTMTRMTRSNDTPSSTQIPVNQCGDNGSGDSVFNQNSSSTVVQNHHLHRSNGRGAGVNPVPTSSSTTSTNSCDDKSQSPLSSITMIPDWGGSRELRPVDESWPNQQRTDRMSGRIIMPVEESKQMSGNRNRIQGSRTEDLITAALSSDKAVAAGAPHAPDLIELESAITDLIDFAGIVQRRPQIMNPLYVPVIESCLHDLALLVLAQQQEQQGNNNDNDGTTRTGKLNILKSDNKETSLVGGRGASTHNNTNPIDKSSVQVLMDLLRYLAETSSSGEPQTPVAGDDLLGTDEMRGKRGRRLDGEQKRNNDNKIKNMNLEKTLHVTKIENQNKSTELRERNKEEDQRLKLNSQKDSVPIPEKAKRKKQASLGVEVSNADSSSYYHQFSKESVKEDVVEEDATTMAMALDYLKTMTKSLRETQIDNNKVNNQPTSIKSFHTPPPPLPPFIDKGGLNVTTEDGKMLMVNCRDDSNLDPRICKEIIESGNSGNVIPMSSFQLPTTTISTGDSAPPQLPFKARVPLKPPMISMPIPVPPPLPTHLFYNPPPLAAVHPIRAEEEDASASSGHNRGDINSSSSNRCASIIQAQDPPIRRHFTHSTHPQIMLRQQHHNHREEEDDRSRSSSAVSSCHYRIDSGAIPLSENEFNIRQHHPLAAGAVTEQAADTTSASFSSVVTTVTRTFDLNAVGGTGNGGTGPDSNSRGQLQQNHRRPVEWNEQTRDARLNAIVAPECDRNADQATRELVMLLPNIVGGGGSVKRSFSADNTGRVVDKCSTWTRDCYSDAIMDSQWRATMAAPLASLDTEEEDMDCDGDDDDAATAIEVRVQRAYDMDSLWLTSSRSSAGGDNTCVDQDNDDEDRNSNIHSDEGIYIQYLSPVSHLMHFIVVPYHP